MNTDIDTRECGECHNTLPNWQFDWVKDRYGIPYRKVCFDCFDNVRQEIQGWEFDPDYAGESLD